MRYFCTYFDSAYLSRGLALYQSLREHCPAFRLWVLCLDQVTYECLRDAQYPGIETLLLTDLELSIAGLTEAKLNRSRVEYYFTCTPALPLYVLEKHSFVDLITYLDSDLYFYSTPEPLFEEMKSGSVGIIAHRFPSRLELAPRHGVYNVSWVSFRRDEVGLACVRWWSDQCLEWCYHRIEEDRYADQKYLDQFPRRFERVVVLEHPGANLAPWNIENHPITEKRGMIEVAEKPLIFFHFHGFLQLSKNSYATGLGIYQVHAPRSVVRMIFEPYIRVLRNSVGAKLLKEGLVYKTSRGGPWWKRALRPLRQAPQTLQRWRRGEQLFYISGIAL